MKTIISVLLSSMMFLPYYIWGAWYVTMGTYMGEVLKSSGMNIGAAYSAGAIATIISPFFVGMIADRLRGYLAIIESIIEICSVVNAIIDQLHPSLDQLMPPQQLHLRSVHLHTLLQLTADC